MSDTIIQASNMTAEKITDALHDYFRMSFIRSDKDPEVRQLAKLIISLGGGGCGVIRLIKNKRTLADLERNKATIKTIWENHGAAIRQIMHEADTVIDIDSLEDIIDSEYLSGDDKTEQDEAIFELTGTFILYIRQRFCISIGDPYA